MKLAAVVIVVVEVVAAAVVVVILVDGRMWQNRKKKYSFKNNIKKCLRKINKIPTKKQRWWHADIFSVKHKTAGKSLQWKENININKQ